MNAAASQSTSQTGGKTATEIPATTATTRSIRLARNADMIGSRKDAKIISDLLPFPQAVLAAVFSTNDS